MQTVVIDPVTRIEGHSKITIQLDDHGMVQDAHFHVTQFRGFEKLCEGRPFYEMPALMARICGICPVSHLIASAKACDAILAVRIPETAEKLRRIMNLAQIVQSHALSFFHLSSPDFLLGMDSDPAKRNIFGVAEHSPELARDGIRLRKFGQEIIELLGGKRIHPAWVVPGGVSEPLKVEHRDEILRSIPEAKDIVFRTLGWFKRQLESFREEIRTFANFPSLFMALTKEDGDLAFYKGWLRFVDADGEIVKDHIDPANYEEFIGEAVEPWSYLKSPYYKPLGYPKGMYRVGPLARLNMAKRCGTPLADQELAEFRELERRFVLSSFYYHYARLIEALFAIERIEAYLEEPDILGKHVRAYAGPNNYERRWSSRSAAWNADPQLQDRRERTDYAREPDHRYRPQQSGDESGRVPGREAFHKGKNNSGRHVKSRRSRHSLLRSMLELFDARHGSDAAASPTRG